MSNSSNQANRVHTGNCLCGAVRYKVIGPLRDVVNCHCSLCRKFHGHFGAYTAALRKNVRIKNENNLLAWYRGMNNHARRGFCVICGSSLFWDLEDASTLSIAVGTLDQPTGLCTTTHIYTEDKGDYYNLSEDLLELAHGLGAAKHSVS